jgi:plastocyanin
MPAPQIVNVKYDGAHLTLHPPSVQLGSGDWVEWRFSNVPADCIPSIQFEKDVLGPFQCLQTISNTTVQGKGNVGAKEDVLYTYTARLLDLVGVPASTGEPGGTVVSLQQTPNTSPEVVVVYKEGVLTVSPEALDLYPGDTATWNVFGLPPDHSVTIQFDPLVIGPDNQTAMFESFLTCRPVVGEDPDIVQVCGVHFNDLKTLGRYSYRVAVRDSSGIVVASHDPTIDNLGEPGPPDPDGGES